MSEIVINPNFRNKLWRTKMEYPSDPFWSTNISFWNKNFVSSETVAPKIVNIVWGSNFQILGTSIFRWQEEIVLIRMKAGSIYFGIVVKREYEGMPKKSLVTPSLSV